MPGYPQTFQYFNYIHHLIANPCCYFSGHGG